MGKGGKTQQPQTQSQRKGGQQNPKQTRDKPSRGCCGCIFSVIRKLILLTAISGFLYVATFTGYHYHVKQRLPTLDEFKQFSLESYDTGSQITLKYYAVAEKHSKEYYAHFEREYLPTIQLYTKKYTKLAVEKAGDLKQLSVKYFAIAQQQVDALYVLALEKFAEFQSGGKADPTPAAPKRAPESKPPTPKATPTAAPTPKPTPKPTQAPTPAPSRATTPKPTQASQTQPPKAATPKPATATKPTEAPKKAPSSKEKREL